MTDRMRAAVFDDHPLLREGVIHTLRMDEAIEVVAEGECAQSAIEIAETIQPDVILLDVNMPGDGIRAAAKIRNDNPEIRIIMLTVCEDELHVRKCLDIGVEGYIAKGVKGRELIAAVKQVCSGQRYVSPELAAKIFAQRRGVINESNEKWKAITAREEHVLLQLIEGLTNKEIATKLHLSEKTVKHYMANIMQKVQARNRVEVALMAQERFQTGEPLAPASFEDTRGSDLSDR